MPLISDRLGKMGVGQRAVLAVKSVSSGTGGWNEDKFLPGDVIEQLRLESQVNPLMKSPFVGGKTGFLRELRKLAGNEKICVRILRQGRRVEVTAAVVSEESVLRKHYALADHEDKSYIVALMEATEEDCAMVQDQTQKVMEEMGRSKICNIQMRGCLISYSWQQKMELFLPPPNSAIVFSLLIMPFQPTRSSVEFNDVDDTSARAMAWLSASQKIGVPIIFVNIQTEPILRQGSSAIGFGVGSQEDALNVVNSGSYTVHDEAGSDIGILRGIRLWYAPAASEMALNLIPEESERLGVGISHTEEGFCYVSSVEYGTAADRAGLKQIHESAQATGKLLVISRIAGRKVTPWMVQSSGAIRCFDTLLISEILSLHRQSLQPIQLYVLLWNGFTLPRAESLDMISNNHDSTMQISRARSSSSSSRVVRWDNSSVHSIYSSDSGVRSSSVDRQAQSPRPSSGSTWNSSARYFNNLPESSENEDFSFSF